MNQPQPIRVLIRSADGRYLAGSNGCWEFTKDRTRAAVFDYERDRVREQLEWLRRAGGTECTVIRLEPREAYERCDRCGRRLMVFKAFFDGGEYLCPDCREKGFSPL